MNAENLAYPPKWRRVALAVCMFLITSVFGFVQPFVPLYMQSAGLTLSQIGLVMGTATGLALLIQPLLGRLSDRLDARRPLMALSAITAGIAYSSYRFAGSQMAFVLLTALGVNGIMYLNAVGGVLIGRMIVGAGQGGAAYAGYRKWGSVGYIFVTLLTGWLTSRSARPGVSSLSHENLTAVFTYGPVLFFVIAIVALLVPDRKNQPISPSLPLKEPEDGPGLPPELRAFLLSFFLYNFALYGASAYLSPFLKALHAGPEWITRVFAAGVVCEVLVMTQVGRFTDIYGRRPALAVAYLLMPIRLLFYIPATGPVWVLIVQTLHGLNFGIMGAIAVVFINDMATDRNRGAAQARLAATQGLANALGPFTCGWIAQQWGYGAMFGAMSAVGAMGAVVFMTRVHESHPDSKAIQGRGPAVLQPLWRLLDAPPEQKR